MGKPGPKAYSVINDLLKKAKGKGGKSPLKQQNLNKSALPAYPGKKSTFKRGMGTPSFDEIYGK